jgi:hypothetical protein
VVGLGPHLYVTNQIQTNLNQVTECPSAAHPLGTAWGAISGYSGK